MNDRTPLDSLAESLLGQTGLSATRLEAAPGFANNVWLTPESVIRLNHGRFPEAFRHEAEILKQLRGIIPVPDVLAVGVHDAGGEFIIFERLPGLSLQDAWPELSLSERRNLCEEAGSMIRELHTIPLQDWMSNPWVEQARLSRNAGDSYHAPASDVPWLAESATRVRPDLTDVIQEISSFVEQRSCMFQDEARVFIHADLHFRNIIVHQGNVTGLVDFEGARPAPRDMEMDMLVRWLSGQMEADRDGHADVIPGIRTTYPELLDSDDLVEKLEVYELLWQLVQIHHWIPGARWMNDPAESVAEVLIGSFGAKVARILSQV